MSFERKLSFGINSLSKILPYQQYVARAVWLCVIKCGYAVVLLLCVVTLFGLHIGLAIFAQYRWAI